MLLKPVFILEGRLDNMWAYFWIVLRMHLDKSDNS